MYSDWSTSKPKFLCSPVISSSVTHIRVYALDQLRCSRFLPFQMFFFLCMVVLSCNFVGTRIRIYAYTHIGVYLRWREFQLPRCFVILRCTVVTSWLQSVASPPCCNRVWCLCVQLISLLSVVESLLVDLPQAGMTTTITTRNDQDDDEGDVPPSRNENKKNLL